VCKARLWAVDTCAFGCARMFVWVCMSPKRTYIHLLSYASCRAVPVALCKSYVATVEPELFSVQITVQPELKHGRARTQITVEPELFSIQITVQPEHGRARI